MRNIFATLLLFALFLMSSFAKADTLKKGAFICKSKELLDEMISIAVNIADAKNGSSGYYEQLASLMMNNQCSITDKEYKASMLDSGFSKHKIRLYDDEGNNFVVWTPREDYVRK